MLKHNWTDEYATHFNAIKNCIVIHTENIYFDPQFETRVKCDASRSGFRAALDQLMFYG